MNELHNNKIFKKALQEQSFLGIFIPEALCIHEKLR